MAQRAGGRAGGFSLVELMMALAIVGILAVVTYPAFMAQLHKSRRLDAIAALAQVQQAQERWRANNTTYAGSLAALGLSPPGSGRYRVAISDSAAHGYTATASAAESQASDTLCSSLSVTLSGGNTTYSSTGSAAAGTCWNR
ncbi:type IV pilin protein [Methylibium sp.]|uniref:type IV pilin protein n=1 Tax=Methylibium sp. TaxID=2067992 RepID=UPI003D0A5004